MGVVNQEKDPATDQTVSGIPSIKDMNTAFRFTKKETDALRRLADKIAGLSQMPLEQKKARIWTDHNDLKNDQPLVFADPENGWNEIIPSATLECRDPLARVWEMHLKKKIYWAEQIKDDMVIENVLDVPYSFSNTGWGVDIELVGGDNGGSYVVNPPIIDYVKDFAKLKFPQIIIDHDQSEKVMNLAHHIFDGILEVRRKGRWWWTLGMTSDYINLRGLQNFMLDTLLEKEWAHRMMAFLRDGILNRLDFLEKNSLLALNTAGTYVGSGGFGWTTQLPAPGFTPEKVRTQDMWGFCESQESVGINPDAFGEIIFPYQLSILNRFGLNCYGCCEPLDSRWKYIKQIPRLRRVSVSPWSNKKKMAEFINTDYVMSVKPSPTPLAVHNMDEGEVRLEIRNTLKDTKGCIVELIMKDNHTLGNNPNNIVRWVEIVREEIGRM